MQGRTHNFSTIQPAPANRKFVDSNRLKFPGMPLSGQHSSGRQTAHPNHHLPAHRRRQPVIARAASQSNRPPHPTRRRRASSSNALRLQNAGSSQPRRSHHRHRAFQASKPHPEPVAGNQHPSGKSRRGQSYLTPCLPAQPARRRITTHHTHPHISYPAKAIPSAYSLLRPHRARPYGMACRR